LIQSADKLCKLLGYEFNDPQLLQTALSHRSVGSNNNERMEYLGDAILGFVVADILYQRFSEAGEGQLSRLRAHLVNGESLAELAQEISLGDYLHLGPGELKSGGFRRVSILAGALEALFGAVYLDSGFQEIERLIVKIYQQKLSQVTLEQDTKDPKTRLQEFLQARKKALPIYTVISVEGREHEQLFKVKCDVDGGDEVIGQGVSRRRAEQDAAAIMLEMLVLNK